MPDAYFNLRRAPTDLASGRVLGPGESAPPDALTLGKDEDTGRPTHDQLLVDEGALAKREVPEDDGVLRGKALEQRARELGVWDSRASADDQRAAVAEAEAEQDPDDPNPED